MILGLADTSWAPQINVGVSYHVVRAWKKVRVRSANSTHRVNDQPLITPHTVLLSGPGPAQRL